MKRLALIALVSAALLSMAGSGAAQSSNRDTVTVKGCTIPGVEGGCLMLKGADGVLWDITAAKPRPEPGRVVRLTGEKSNRASYCMQGAQFDRIEWRYTGQHCPSVAAPLPSAARGVLPGTLAARLAGFAGYHHCKCSRLLHAP